MPWYRNHHDADGAGRRDHRDLPVAVTGGRPQLIRLVPAFFRRLVRSVGMLVA